MFLRRLRLIRKKKIFKTPKGAPWTWGALLLRFLLLYISRTGGAFATNKHEDCGKTDKDVDRPFNHWPRAQDKTNDVPVATKNPAETDKTPIKTTNNYQYPS